MEQTSILSFRELEIIQLIAEGLTDHEIGDKLEISAKTASTHRKNILRKLNLHNTALLVSYAFKNNLVK